jgi:lipoyl(octanoyl) transferase
MHAQTQMITDSLTVRDLGLQDYLPLWQQMQTFTQTRTATTPDQLWLVEHPPVFTLGLNGSHDHLLNPGDIPVVQVDRGGQVTYHGPGQLLLYPLIDLARRQLGVKQFVALLEQTIINFLQQQGITATRRAQAPGVYVADAKIAAVGLRVKRGCSYHGLAFNVAMDLAPFRRINPCGFQGLHVTQLHSLLPDVDPPSLPQIKTRLTHLLRDQLGYNAHSLIP